jgi:DNA-directed RNA polymerase specialized sigma subunit
MRNFTNFTKIIAINEASKLVSNDIMTIQEIKEYLEKVGKKIPKQVADIVYLTAKYSLTSQQDIDDIRDANKSKLDKLAFKYNIPQAEIEDIWKSLKELKTNLRLLPQYQTSSERAAFMAGKLIMSDITIDVETSAGRNACAKQYVGLVNKIVNQFVGKCPLGKPELMSAGQLGFVHAMNTWRKNVKNTPEDVDNKTVPFKTYAGYCVRNQILQDINNLGYIVKTNQNAIAKHGSSLFQGKSLDGFGVNNDDDFKQDRLAVLGIEDADHNLSKNEEDLFKDLYKFIDGKFKQRDIDIFYRYFGLNGYQKEKGKDIAKHLGISASMVTAVVNMILNNLKKDKKAMDILMDLQSAYNESLMLDIMNLDREMMIEAILSDDTFILLEELTKWSNKNVYITALKDSFNSLDANESKMITNILSEGFDYLDKVYKSNKKTIIKFLTLMYPTESFVKKTDVAILEYMDELATLYKKYV